MKKYILKSVAIGLLALSAFAGQAQASTLTPSGPACSVGSVVGATQCAGVFDGNNSNQDLNGLFGIADWGTEYKIDSNAGSVNFSGTTLNVSDGSSKSWSLSSVGNYANLMFVLKGGPTFSAFLMDTSILSGLWNNASMLKGNGQPGAGLSHWSVYVEGVNLNNPPSSVPLPAAGWMLLAGLGGLAAMRRRRKAA